MHEWGPPTWRLNKRVWQDSPKCIHWAACAHETTPPGESEESGKCCSICMQGCPLQRKCEDSGALLCTHVELPYSERVQSYQSVWCLHTGLPHLDAKLANCGGAFMQGCPPGENAEIVGHCDAHTQSSRTQNWFVQWTFKATGQLLGQLAVQATTGLERRSRKHTHIRLSNL